MGKITPGVTPEDEFRRVINEAGGNVQINTTPANLLKALKDIGGNVSYDSGDTAIVPAVNEGSVYPKIEGTIRSGIGYDTSDIGVNRSDLYSWCHNLSLRIVPAPGEYIYQYIYYLNPDRFKSTGLGGSKCLYGISITIDNVKIPLDDMVFTLGAKVQFRKNKITENILGNLNTLIGKPVKIHVESGTFNFRGPGDLNDYNDTYDVEFNFGDTISVDHNVFPSNTYTLGQAKFQAFDKYSNWNSGEYVEGNDYIVSPYYNETFALFNSLTEDVSTSIPVVLDKPVSFCTEQRGWVTLPAKIIKSQNDIPDYIITSTEVDPYFTKEPAYYTFKITGIVPIYENGKLQSIKMNENYTTGGYYRVSYISSHIKKN